MAFSVENLINKVDEYNAKGQKGSGEFAKTAFLPEGKHRGRFIVDAAGEAFTSYYAYGYFSKGVRDPRNLPANLLPEGFVDELATIAQTLSDRGKFQYKAKEVFIVPFYLEQTDNQSDNWKPNTLYYVIGNKKFSKSLTGFLGNIAKDSPNEIQRMLDPNQPSVQVEIQMTKGTSGGCNIGVAFPQKQSPAVDLTKQVYVTLEEAYIRPGFDIAKYNALLAQAKEELAKTPEKAEDGSQAENQAKEFNAQPPVNATEQAVAGQTTTGGTFTNPQTVSATVVDSQSVAQQPAPTPEAQAPADDPWAKFKSQA